MKPSRTVFFGYAISIILLSSFSLIVNNIGLSIKCCFLCTYHTAELSLPVCLSVFQMYFSVCLSISMCYFCGYVCVLSVLGLSNGGLVSFLPFMPSRFCLQSLIICLECQCLSIFCRYRIGRIQMSSSFTFVCSLGHTKLFFPFTRLLCIHFSVVFCILYLCLCLDVSVS